MTNRIKGGYAFTFQKTNWQLYNSPRLTRLIRDKMREAVNEAGDVALDKFKEYIQEDVYNAYTPVDYERTNDLLNSWFFYIGNNMNRGNHFTTNFTLYQDSNKMIYNPNLYQHGSEVSGDMRYAIANFVFNGVTGGMFGDGEFSKPRDALGDFQEWLNKNLNQEIQKAMDKRGI